MNPNLNSIVLLMTVSQGRDFYDVERFAGKNRGHVIIDNNRSFNPGTIVGATDFTVPNNLAPNAVEFLETTLPHDNLIMSTNKTTRTSSPFKTTSPTSQGLIFNQAYWVLGEPQVNAAGKYHEATRDTDLSETWDILLLPGTQTPEVPRTGGLSNRGSGGNYLSNESFYRTALVRTNLQNATAIRA